MKTIFDIKEMGVILYQEDIGHNNYFGERNKAWISGILEEEFQYSHTIRGKTFYKNRIRTLSNGGQEYCVPIVVSENKLAIANKSVKGRLVEVAGEFRSHNFKDEYGNGHLMLFVFPRYINICDTEGELQEGINHNIVYLEGTICKVPIHRITPLSGKRITDVFVAVNRSYHDSDYIPAIVWNIGSMYVKRNLDIGSKVRILGSIQNRMYLKRNSPDSDEGEYKEAYELSAMWIEKK